MAVSLGATKFKNGTHTFLAYYDKEPNLMKIWVCTTQQYDEVSSVKQNALECRLTAVTPNLKSNYL